MSQDVITKSVTERVLIVGLRRQRMSREYSDASLAELAALVDTAGGDVVADIYP